MNVATCLQHVPFEGPGMFRQALKSQGYVIRTSLVPSQGLPQDPGDFLLMMGGPLSVNDADSWIAEELDFVQAAMNTDIPVLGICFGAQLLAKALGGSVVPGPIFETGMVPVTLTEAGTTDTVFRQLPSAFHVFQWHGEGMILPAEIPSLVASGDFPVQAFRVRDRCYGLLFHPEIEEEGIQALCHECPEDVRKGGIPPGTIQAQATPYLPMWHQWADRLIAHLTP